MLLVCMLIWLKYGKKYICLIFLTLLTVFIILLRIMKKKNSIFKSKSHLLTNLITKYYYCLLLIDKKLLKCLFITKSVEPRSENDQSCCHKTSLNSLIIHQGTKEINNWNKQKRNQRNHKERAHTTIIEDSGKKALLPFLENIVNPRALHVH